MAKRRLKPHVKTSRVWDPIQVFEDVFRYTQQAGHERNEITGNHTDQLANVQGRTELIRIARRIAALDAGAASKVHKAASKIISCHEGPEYESSQAPGLTRTVQRAGVFHCSNRQFAYIHCFHIFIDTSLAMKRMQICKLILMFGCEEKKPCKALPQQKLREQQLSIVTQVYLPLSMLQ